MIGDSDALLEMQRDVKAIAGASTNILYSIRMDQMEQVFLHHPF
jgi:hypothetical protein